jgi:ubiquinol-cytochrome c reductase cytochrome c1 subunit
MSQKVNVLMRAAAATGKSNGRKSGNQGQKRSWSSKAVAAGIGAVAVAGAVGVAHAEHALDPPHYPWKHGGFVDKYDCSSIRRGHQVFKQICMTCHGLKRIAYRNLVGVAYTEEEVKEMASEVEYDDEPNDEGEVEQRPGKLSDYMKGPYANESQARFANGGAYPPDLSVIVKGRPRHEDYVFALLLGYKEPPAGVTLREGLHYNPYFPGGAIGMGKQLENGMVDYEDGTEASAAQMAKDVSVFLAWASEPEQDERKLMGLKAISGLAIAAVGAAYFKRFTWSVMKTRRIEFHV